MNTKNLSTASEELPIIQLLNQILLDAVQAGVSDLHFEPYDNVYRLRVRQDGILYEKARFPSKLAAQITSRLKIMANLDIAERRLPQDGRFKLNDILDQNIQINISHIDFRLSSCPTLFGEKLVLRILDSKQIHFEIDSLGFTPEQKTLLLDHLHKPQGMLLATGPTGSGKTRSLYTALQLLNQPSRNIVSCEDPVEIYLPGINQVNIHVKAGLTFANVLRAFLRQDPDVIMVGEIRDYETAEIAIKAAQTGHLVLSTLHTNSAVESINRLLHMGIAHFNLASALGLVIAQRLARKLCSFCKIPEIVSSETLLQLGFTAEELPRLTLFAAEGCRQCQQGYRGRIGIYELLSITPALQDSILHGLHPNKIERQAVEAGMWTLRKAALHAVKQGNTSLAEIQRIL